MKTAKYYIYFSLLILIASCGDGERTPSRIRLEKICRIKLPTNYKVLKDEYQDMITDYCILYDIQLDGKSSSDLIYNIKRSPFYNPAVRHDGIWSYDYFIKVDSMMGVWCRSKKGYDFD